MNLDIAPADIDGEGSSPYVPNYREWLKKKQRHGISVAVYVATNSMEAGLLSQQLFLIGDPDKEPEKEYVWVAARQCYDERLGLYFPEEN